MINWDEVTVGETEICQGGKHPRKVLAVFDDWVWLKDLSGCPCTYYKKSLTHWTIYDPWEEITEECEWEPLNGHNHGWRITYDGDVVLHDDMDYKSDGRRVWKRKEA